MPSPAPPNPEPRIRVLPELVVNKIAAGEVIERPASVVKELVENSLDAGASRVEVLVEDGGTRLIRVSDDGEGMAEADLRLAFAPHATSKLRGEDDLFDIHTMGFRGEALASIASVAQVRLASRQRGAVGGHEVSAEGGAVGPLRAAGVPEGTLAEVRNLFYNTPVRRKFLKTVGTELRHVCEAITRLALPRPDATFHLTHGKRPVLRLPAVAGVRERAAALFGAETAEALLDMHEETPALAVSGLVGPPSLAQRSPKMQYVFLNGRHIRDRTVQRAIIEAYRGRMVQGTFPVVLLFLNMDPARVDVNVHPTKVEVRFRDPGAVYALALAAVERALAAAPETAGIPPADANQRRETVEQALRDYFASGRGQRDEDERGRGFPGSDPPSRLFHPQGEGHAPRPAPLPEAPGGRNVLQVAGTYLVEETAEGFQLIDQHALHERLLYLELARRSREAAVSRQRLLVPEVVELKPADFALAMELRDELKRMGVEIEAFGDSTVAVHAVPHMMRHVNPGELFCEVLEEARRDADGESGRTREERMLLSMACKGAVKAGQALSRQEVDALLGQRDRLSPPPTCPHGRPHTVSFRLEDIERRFRRR